MNDPVMIDIQWISIIIGTLIPILVGFLTKLDAPAGLKAVVNAFISAVSGALVTILENGGAFVPREALVAIGSTWVVSIATYYGLWKPTGVSERVQSSTASFGLTSSRNTFTLKG